MSITPTASGNDIRGNMIAATRKRYFVVTLKFWGFFSAIGAAMIESLKNIFPLGFIETISNAMLFRSTVEVMGTPPCAKLVKESRLLSDADFTPANFKIIFLLSEIRIICPFIALALAAFGLTPIKIVYVPLAVFDLKMLFVLIGPFANSGLHTRFAPPLIAALHSLIFAELVNRLYLFAFRTLFSVHDSTYKKVSPQIRAAFA